MGKRIVRLEQLLRLWEDTCFLNKLNLQVQLQSAGMLDQAPQIIPEPLNHFGELRQHIVEQGTSGNFDRSRFFLFYESPMKFNNLIHMPASLFSWNHHSRRVFHLTSEMQTLLSATSLEGIFMNEIKWPFASFILTLEDPIANEKGEQFDCVLVSEIGNFYSPDFARRNIRFFDFLALSRQLEEYKPLDRERIKRFATPRKWDETKMRRKIAHLGQDFVDEFYLRICPNSPDDIPADIKLADSIKEEKKIFANKTGLIPPEESESQEDIYGSYQLCDKIQHLVLSVCLYLATLPPKKFPEDWQPAEKDKEPVGKYNPAAITTPNGIFTISCESTLSRESQETVAAIKQSRISREKRPHWRRGHWRKVWGGRNNPDSPRIWIHPSLINKHRLPPHSLPIGSRVTLER